ncbi:hypothetical protein M758_UG081000 [Ceratodon purpureus]|nr:hypothetical protein M758_UG081000 [Ceratodon purpureus]
MKIYHLSMILLHIGRIVGCSCIDCWVIRHKSTLQSTRSDPCLEMPNVIPQIISLNNVRVYTRPQQLSSVNRNLHCGSIYPASEPDINNVSPF